MSNQEHINSYIDSIPNSCANTIIHQDSENVESYQKSFENIKCAELKQEQLNNFCYYDTRCNLICPKDVKLSSNTIPIYNNSTIIDTFIGDYKFRPNKKYFDPEVFTLNGFVNRVNNNISNIYYRDVHNSLAGRYNNIIGKTPFSNLTQRLIDENNSTIENLDPNTPSSGDGGIGSSTSSSSSFLFFIILGVGIYFLFVKNNNLFKAINSTSSDNSLSTDSSAPSV
jgi:hypothetical protein